ncbi:MAG: hypothetical protein U0805_10740 [Pirellulales bacterium]
MATAILCGNELALDPAIAERARLIREGNGFESRPDAEPMARRDVLNVSRLDPLQARKMLDAIAASIVSDEDSDPWDWEEHDARWELTPHELRKLNEAKRKVKRMAKL